MSTTLPISKPMIRARRVHVVLMELSMAELACRSILGQLIEMTVRSGILHSITEVECAID